MLPGFVLVALSMAVLFTVPERYFVAATFGATSCMIAVAIASREARKSSHHRPDSRMIAIGIASAIGLYLVFFVGNVGIRLIHPFGLGASSENSIYSLIASPSNPLPLQFAVLAFDAVGYEAYFRGVLQRYLQRTLVGGGVACVFVTAMIDSVIHVITLNPLWVVTTFIADTGWGLTYYYTRNLASNTTSHLVWDLLIFIVAPIR